MQQDQADRLRPEYEVDGYVYPAYGDRCFADVAPTALSLLTDSFDRGLPDAALEPVLDAGGDSAVDRVVLLVVDGFGLDQWRRLRDRLALLADFEADGSVTPLTSVYPSETAAAITTLHTGALPVEHGLLGWWQYVEAIDTVLQTLPFETADGEDVRELHADAGADFDMLVDADPLYGDASDDGLTPQVVQPEKLVGTASSDVLTAGAETHGYWNVADMGVQLRDIVADADPGTHVTAYVPNVDSISHVTGTATDRYDAQVRMVLDAIRDGFVAGLDAETAERTALLLTADHGHTNVDPAENVDLDRPEVWSHLADRPTGDPVPPVGGPRNVQFHAAPGECEALREVVESNHEVATFTAEQYRDRGLFGDHAQVDRDVVASDTFDRRAPDLLAVHRTRAMWHEADDKVGVHGGLTPAEMLVPFAAARVADLQG